MGTIGEFWAFKLKGYFRGSAAAWNLGSLIKNADDKLKVGYGCMIGVAHCTPPFFVVGFVTFFTRTAGNDDDDADNTVAR